MTPKLLRITSIPSAVAFEIALFPHNVPLPPPKISARILGGVMHLFHLCVRVSRIRKVPDSDLGWEDMYREGEGEPLFDWVRRFFFNYISQIYTDPRGFNRQL